MSGVRSLAALALCVLASCAVFDPPLLPPLARARAAADYDSYDLRRVGIVPFGGGSIDAGRARELQQAFLFELSRRAQYEIVLLDEEDLAEVDANRPYERGTYRAHSITEIARRFRLDGLLVGTVTHLEPYTPQSLGIELELVASETGLVIWSSTLEIDTADVVVRESIDRYDLQERTPQDAPNDKKLMLLSPSRLMRFAASEVARTL